MALRIGVPEVKILDSLLPYLAVIIHRSLGLPLLLGSLSLPV